MGTMQIEIEDRAGQIWDALTSQDALRDWFNATTEIELRQGGSFRFEEALGDEVFRFEGMISVLKPNERIAFDLRSATGTAATLSFTIQSGGDFTTVELRHDGFDRRDGTSFWDGDELIALREYVTGIGPTH
jgi:uncharacterized protein YndB with AHSA1/START domain